jgi:osmotically inducible lipoprotein OsmB
MNRRLIATCALAGMMTLTACANMSDSQKSMATGAAIGGAAAGIISGQWGWAAAGAAAGAVGGYLYDKNK